MTTKERILQYIDYKGISQYDFSKKTGLSNGFLKAGSNVTSENLKLISTTFVDLNLDWVITGEGEMIRPVKDPLLPYLLSGDGQMPSVKDEFFLYYLNEEMIKALQKIVATQEELIQALNEQIKLLKA